MQVGRCRSPCCRWRRSPSPARRRACSRPAGDSNVFTQIAWLVLVGRAARNAVLVVEFARERGMAGLDPLAAVIEAARLRLLRFL